MTTDTRPPTPELDALELEHAADHTDADHTRPLPTCGLRWCRAPSHQRDAGDEHER